VKRDNKYSAVALKAYEMIINNKTLPEEAWKRAGRELGLPKSSIDKGCPYQVFIGLCTSGDLKGIPATKISLSDNYKKAKAAIKFWKSEEEASYEKVWGLVKKELHFNTTP
jgi:hypothetical protein